MLRDFRRPSSYYDILKVPPHTTNEAVFEAYTSLLNQIDSEKNLRNKNMKVLRLRLLNEAYAALRTQEGRNRYNRLLLINQGKPKGLALKPDNDNKRVSNDRGIWGRLSELLSLNSSLPVDKKEQDHG